MADNSKTIRDLEAMYDTEKRISDMKIQMLKEESARLNNILDMKRRMQIQEEIAAEHKKIAASMQEAYNDTLRDGYTISTNTTLAIERRIKAQEDLAKQEEKSVKIKKEVLNVNTKINGVIKQTLTYLMDSDRVIKQTILSLGLSAGKAELMRTSFENSAMYVARMGGDLGDIQKIMQGFADETGMARVLTTEMVKDITKMGRGTSMGVENATKLAAQFELMGVDVKRAMEYVQGVVETSELMGLNTDKVIKNISDNFKTLQKYNFQQGVKGFAEMSSYSEKFKINMESVLNSASMARNLENAVDLAANLQVMGGEFAKSDPFQLLFLSRNDPAAYTKKINEMTKGLVSFKKMSDGSFEKFISPADRDRLESVAKSLGMSTEELTAQSLRMADIQKMRQHMVGMGLSDSDKNLIEGMGKFNNELGLYNVKVAGRVKDIRDLTAEEIKVLGVQEKSLEKRALNSQTFDEAWRNTIAEFKTILLPLLRGVNTVLEKVRPIAIQFTEWVDKLSKEHNGWLTVGLTLLAAAGAWKAITFGGKMMASRFVNRGTKSTGSQLFGKGKMMAGAGKGMMGAGAGIGAAALGVGAGIGAAAAGISLLADSMSKLDEKQAETLKSIVTTLGISIGITTLAAAGIMVFGNVSALAAPGLGMFALAALGVGAGIGVAAAGIGFAAQQIGNLVEKSKGADTAMLNVGKGIGLLGVGMASLSVGGLFGLPMLANTLATISSFGPGMDVVGKAMTNFTSLKGMAADFIAAENMVKAISNAKIDQNNVIGQLGKLLSKPLKVEFDNKEVNLVSNISLAIDGQKFVEHLAITERVMAKIGGLDSGKSAEKVGF